MASAGGIERPRESSAARWVAVPLVALAYVLLGVLGRSTSASHAAGSLICPSAGLSLACVILFGTAAAIGVYIGALVVALSGGGPLGLGLLLAAGATSAAVLGAALLRWVADFEPGLDRLHDVLAFLAVVVFASAPAGATIDVCSLLADGRLPTHAHAGSVWITWWLGDAGGAVIVAPLLLVAVRGSPAWGAMARRAESWALLGLLCFILGLAFGGWIPQPSTRLFIAFLAFPFLAWAGLRLGPRGAVVAALVTATAGVLGTTRRLGPFVYGDLRANMVALWAYATTMSATAMILAAAWAERDHAEQKRILGEKERSRVEAHLRQVQRLESLGALAGGVAHDFNNILATIRGSAELAGMSHKLDRDVRGLLDGIERATDRGADLCGQLLTYAGEAEPSVAKVHLASFLDDMRQLVRVSVPDHIVVEFALEEIPPITADAAQLRQVLMALVVNAAEAIGDRPGTIRISSYVAQMEAYELHPTRLVKPAGPYAALEVTDDGIGLEYELHPRVFEPFYTTKFPGRGLGLSAALGIVHAHGGSIDIVSEPGRGSRFRVLIPLPSEAAPTPVPAAAARLGEGGVLDGRKEDQVRQAAVRALEQAGWQVELTRSEGAPRPSSSVHEEDGEE